MRSLVPAAFVCLFCATVAGIAVAADKGVVTYAVGNCFIMETDKGQTLFERSGGAVPEAGQAVSGPLHEFGYQQLYDDKGQELFVGWIVNFGLSPGAEIDDFKQNCR